jgi:hypothetical protein
MYLLCLGKPASIGKTYNAGQMELLTPADWIGGIASLLGREVQVVLGPDDAIQSQLQDWYPPLSFRFVHSISAARRDLDFKSTPFAHWLDVTTRWFVDSHSGPDSAGYAERAKEIQVADKLIGNGRAVVVTLGKS